MNSDQLSIQLAQLIEHGKEMAVIQESLRAALKRMDKMDEFVQTFHKFTESNGKIASKVEMLAAKFDKYSEGQRAQGERIGNAEKAIALMERNDIRRDKDIAALADKLDALRMEPGERWKNLVMHIVGYVIVGLLAAFAGNYFLY